MSLLPRYTIRDLTPLEKAARRYKLDWAGYNVVLSQAAILLALTLHRRFLSHRKPTRIEYLLSTPISSRFPSLRTYGHSLTALSWSTWCFYLAIRGTGDDYFHITKSLAAVATANTPLHLLLSTKLTPLPLGVYTHLNPLHRSLGRIITLLLFLHSFLYLSFFFAANKLSTRFLEPDVQCGFISFLLLLAISITAFHPLRKASYKVFLIIHITLPVVLFPTLWFHTHHLRPYLGAAVTIWVLDYTLRYTSRVPGRVIASPLAPGLVRLSFTLKQPKAAARYPPGSHVRLNIPSLSSLIHTPLSIISATGGTVQTVMRVRSGATKKLAALLEQRSEGVEAEISPAYGGNELVRDIVKRGVDKVLIITGGVGATFGISLASALVEELDDEDEEYKRVKWVASVRSVEEITWALSSSREVADVTEVYITSNTRGGSEESEEEEGVELLRVEKSEEPVEVLEKLGVERERTHLRGNRPSVSSLVGQAVEEAGVEGSTVVMVCGPEGMGVEARRSVAEWGGRGRDVRIWVEAFGF